MRAVILFGKARIVNPGAEGPVHGRAPRGTWGAVLLPVGGSGTIDWGATDEVVEILCASGLDGIYTNGTAGEFHSQTEAEFDRLSERVADIARRRGSDFQIGVSHTNARVARQRLQRVAPLRPSAAQVILPDWWPPSEAETQRFMTGLAEAAPDTPLVLYNPPHAKRRLTPSDIAGLVRVAPTLVGAKLPGGDAAWFEDVRSLLPGFSVFVPGHRLASGYRDGASGSYSNVACLSPRGAAAWWRRIEAGGDGAMALEARIVAFLEAHIVPLRARYGLSDAGLDKAMAAAGGWGPIGPALLWPYSGVPEAVVPALARAAREALPEFFDPKRQDFR